MISGSSSSPSLTSICAVWFDRAPTVGGAQKRVSGGVDYPSVRNGRVMCCLYPIWGTSVEVLICTKISDNTGMI